MTLVLSARPFLSSAAEDPADVVVEEGDHPVVGGDQLAHRGFVRRLADAEDMAKVFERGVHGTDLRFVGRGPRHPVVRIELVEALRRDERRMGTDQRDEQGPGLVLQTRSLLVEPAHGLNGNVAVVGRVGRLAAPRVGDHRAERPGLGQRVATDDVEQRAGPVHDVHGEDFLVEAVGIADIPIVQLPDGRDPIAADLQAVSPGLFVTPVGAAVVPMPDLVHMAPRGHAGPGRHADGGIAVGAPEERAALREAVQVRRPYDGVPVAPEDPARVLVGEQEHQVRGRHPRELRPERRARRGAPSGND